MLCYMKLRAGQEYTTVFLVFVCVLLSLIWTGVCFSSNFSFCTVEKIIDGDTFVCSGERVRLVGVDTPESVHNPRAEKQARSMRDLETVLELGRRARAFTASLLRPGMQVRLEFDVQVRDRYGRLLAYVWLPDGRMLNEVLLEEGYATLYTVPPNVKYEDRLRKAQERARVKRRGLWGIAGD